MTIEQFKQEWFASAPYVRLHTSGSTGKPKDILGEKSRMLASARATNDFLNLKPGDTALLCLPLDYIAGKMMVVRCIERGMRLIDIKPSNTPLDFFNDGGRLTADTVIDFAAMIPSQVYCSLQDERQRSRLMAIRHLIIGGGAVSDGLARRLKDFPNAVWSTYGMTETLSHIALRRLNGEEATEWYTPMDGIKVDVVPEDDNAAAAVADTDKKRDGKESAYRRGLLLIDAPAIHDGILKTNDIAEMHNDGRRFRIIGRRDNIICSGGIKLQIEEIEDALRQYVHQPFCISKRRDEKFGEIEVMLVENDRKEKGGTIHAALDEAFAHLQRYAVPKDVLYVRHIPTTPNGKIDRKAAMDMAAADAALNV